MMVVMMVMLVMLVLAMMFLAMVAVTGSRFGAPIFFSRGGSGQLLHLARAFLHMRYYKLRPPTLLFGTDVLPNTKMRST